MLEATSRGLSAGQDPRSIGPRYLVVFSSVQTSFRLPEFRAAADYHDLPYCFVPLPRASEPHLHSIDSDPPLALDATKVNGRHQDEDQAGPSRLCLDSLDIHNAKIETDRAVMLVHLSNDDAARLLARRVTSIRSIWQHWTSGTSLDQVKENLEQDEEARRAWTPWQRKDKTWRAIVDGIQRSIAIEVRRHRIDAFEHALDFPGPIRLKDADFEWCYTEEWTPPRVLADNVGEKWEESKRAQDGLDGQSYVLAVSQEESIRKQYQRLLAIHVGRNVTPPMGELARNRINRMDVKKRAYIGNTTMESGMSLVQATMALAGPGKLVYDPFAGTGSLLLAAAALGATTLASDIDARMMKGKPSKASKKLGIIRSAEQYGVQDLILDSLCFDVTQHPIRRGNLFDAIVADPPYGVRAGAKRLGRRDVLRLRDAPVRLTDGSWSHELEDYIPPKRPYALHYLLADLFDFAAQYLVPGGRLVFWMPTMSEVEEEEREEEAISCTAQHRQQVMEGNGIPLQAKQVLELQLPPSKSLRLLAHSLQDFGSWGRRLITMEKMSDVEAASNEIQDLRLPSVPATHHNGRRIDAADADNVQNTIAASPEDPRRPQRIRATDDPNEFRNQYFGSRMKKMHNSSRNAGM